MLLSLLLLLVVVVGSQLARFDCGEVERGEWREGATLATAATVKPSYSSNR